MLTIHDNSHLDHGLSKRHIEFILKKYSGNNEFFIDTFELPASLRSLQSGIYGPVVGDPPVREADVFYRIRGTRNCATRSVRKPMRPSRLVTVIAGPRGKIPCSLYTAYGGPAAPREPGDLNIPSWEEVLAARAFWAEHALSEDT